MPRTSIAAVPSPRALVATPYRRGVLVLALLTLVLRAWTTSRWSWTNDDWFYLHDAATMSFWSYLAQDYNGHLMPGGFLVSWIFTQIAPLNFWLPVVFVTVVSTASVLIWGVALGRLVGERMVTLAPLAIVSLSAIYLRPTVWWAAATQSLTMLFFMGWAVLLAERWNRSPSRRGLVLLLMSYAVALFFWQKSVLLVLPSAAVLIGVSDQPLKQRIGAAIRPLIGLVVLSAIYVPAYLIHTSGTSSKNSIEFDTSAIRDGGVEAVARAFSEVLAPALLGGPWGTLPVNGNPFAHPPVALSVVLGLTIVSAAVAVIVWRRGNWLPVAMAVLYASVAWGMILFSNRFLSLGAATLTDERFNADIVGATIVAVAMIMGSSRSDSRDTASVRSARADRSDRRPTAALAVVALSASLTAANILQFQRMHEQSGRDWVRNVLADFDSRDRPVSMWDANTPLEVLHSGYYPREARLSYALAPLGDRVNFRQVAERLTMIDAQGHLQGVRVSPTSESGTGPDEGCGFSVGGPEPVIVPMTSGLFYWDWAIQVNAIAGEDSTIVMTAGESVTEIPIRAGLNQYQVQVATDVPEQIELTSPPGSPTVCVAEVLVGNVEPVEG